MGRFALTCVWVVCCDAAWSGSSSHAMSVPNGDDIPSLEISLAPPVHPLPDVSMELGRSARSLENADQLSMNKLQRLVNKKTIQVKRRTSEVFNKMAELLASPRSGSQKATFGFLQTPQHPFGPMSSTVAVNVLPASEPDSIWHSLVDQLENARQLQGKAIFEKAFQDVETLGNLVVDELQAQLTERLSSFAMASGMRVQLDEKVGLLEKVQAPPQANIKVEGGREAFPSVASLTKDMMKKRDVIESLERATIMETEIDFILACNEHIRKGLRAVLERVPSRG